MWTWQYHLIAVMLRILYFRFLWIINLIINRINSLFLTYCWRKKRWGKLNLRRFYHKRLSSWPHIFLFAILTNFADIIVLHFNYQFFLFVKLRLLLTYCLLHFIYLVIFLTYFFLKLTYLFLHFFHLIKSLFHFDHSVISYVKLQINYN